MSKSKKTLDGLNAPVELFQRDLAGITAGIDLSHTSRALAEAMRPLAGIAASYDFSHTTRALTEAMRPLAGIAANYDFSYATKALSNAMLPLLSNQQLYTAQIDSLKSITSSVISAIDVPLLSESTWASIASMQRLYADLFKGLDMSYIGESLSQMSLLLKDVYNAWDYEYLDEDEELRIDFEADVKDLVGDGEKQNWQQRFAGKLQKWRTKNPVLAFILFTVIFNIMITILYDTAKYYLVESPQTAIRQLPNPKSEVVLHIEQKEMVTVIGAQNHWVNVVYLNPDDGFIYEGWLSKRSCVEIEQEEQDNLEETEEVEEQSESEEYEINETQSESLDADYVENTEVSENTEDE